MHVTAFGGDVSLKRLATEAVKRGVWEKTGTERGHKTGVILWGKKKNQTEEKKELKGNQFEMGDVY